MSIGPDIKEVLQELGVSFTILRDSGDVTGERLDYDSNSQVTKPFIREHFLEVSFQYDSEVVAGDLIQFSTDQRKFFVVHLDPELFENQIIEKRGVLYKANAVVSVQRPSGEDTDYYQRVVHWNDIKVNQPVTLVDKEYATRLDDEDQDFAQMDLKGLIMFLPASVGILPHDRIVVSGENPYAESGDEMYKVSYLEPHSFRNVVRVFLEEDTRPD